MSKVVPRLIYEDNHLLVVEKPVNIPSQGDESGDPDLLSILKYDLKLRYQKPGQVFLGLVHRLDRPVGGVMVFAKTSKAAARLSAQIRNGEFKKTYVAVVHGLPEKRQGSLKHFLLKDAKQNMVTAVDGHQEGAKASILDYEVMDTLNSLSLVRIHLHTGRSHQIRVQFSEIGHPLWGDQKYGKEYSKSGQQIALWSNEIQCLHPTKNEIMIFTAISPNEFPWNLFDEDIDKGAIFYEKD